MGRPSKSSIPGMGCGFEILRSKMRRRDGETAAQKKQRANLVSQVCAGIKILLEVLIMKVVRTAPWIEEAVGETGRSDLRRIAGRHAVSPSVENSTAAGVAEEPEAGSRRWKTWRKTTISRRWIPTPRLRQAVVLALFNARAMSAAR